MVEEGNASFQKVNLNVVRDFANRTVEASEDLYQKLHQSSSVEVSNAINRLLQIVEKPKSKTSFARIGQTCKRAALEELCKAPVVKLDADKPAVSAAGRPLDLWVLRRFRQAFAYCLAKTLQEPRWLEVRAAFLV